MKSDIKQILLAGKTDTDYLDIIHITSTYQEKIFRLVLKIIQLQVL